MEGYAGWQPAATVDEPLLSEYFARRAHERSALRRKFRLENRHLRCTGRGRSQSFMASWSSILPRQQSACQTHKETEGHITAATRTAGFLTAVTDAGVVLDIAEVIGA
eukprot:920725-Alexandrium_andersonii.AAC.1